MRTHQEWYEDVRRIVLKYQPKDVRDVLQDFPLRFKCYSEDLTEMLTAQMGYGITHAETALTPMMKPKYINMIAHGEFSDPISNAYSLVHELAHVLVAFRGHTGNHTPVWAAAAAGLGIVVHPYAGNASPAGVNPNGDKPEDWTNPQMYAELKALPPPDDYQEIERVLRQHSDGLRHLMPLLRAIW